MGHDRRLFILRSLLGLLLFVVILVSLISPQGSASAAPALTITPLTWNVIGLDSNNVNVGPNDFPVGARVCNNTGSTVTNVTSSFVWDTTDSYINLRPGTLTSFTGSNAVASLANGACTDFYYEVEITRSSSAYTHKARYHITATADSLDVASTPTPRELYIEYLVSQNRNGVRSVEYGPSLGSLTSVPAGGTMTLVVGNTYYIKMSGFTATNGYEQIESFINIPNTIFQVLSVSTTYAADTSSYVSSPNDKLYGDACKWENNPSSPNYRSCLDVGKVGGDPITVTYQLRILQVPSSPLVNPQPLTNLIYDFSGSSYHYNSDFSLSTRYAYVVQPTIAKSFSPKTILAGGTSTLTFSINNPGSTQMTDVNFTDSLPSNVTVSGTGVTYSACGTPSPSSVTNGASSLSFSSITVNGLSTCTVSITVTSSTDGTYNNTTGTLKVGSTDTGNTASDTLIVSSLPNPPSSCSSRTTMATWTLENYTASTSTNSGPFSASSAASDVFTATGSYVSASGSSSGIANPTTFPSGWNAPSSTGNSGNSWGILGGWPSSNPADPTTATSPFFQFQVDASNYGAVAITSSYNLRGNWSASGNWYVLYSTNGSSWTSLNNGVWDKSDAWHSNGITGTASGTGDAIVYFRVFAAGAQYSGNPSTTNGVMYLDGITITGCARPSAPTLSKSFLTTPISTGSTSTLRFTITNPNASTSLSGLSFTDVLPSGLTISSASSSVCGGTLTATSPRTISFSGGSLSGGASCQMDVTVTGSTAGSYTNVSSSISSSETGPNSTSSGYGTSSITVIDPPVIAKAFGSNSILTNNTTSLTLTITNPNTATALSGVGFTDLLPGGLIVATPNGLSNSCGGTATATAGSSSVSLSGGSIPANSSCTVTLNVQGTTTGIKSNSVTVSSSNGGTGNTASTDLLVKDATPALSLLKQVSDSSSGPWTSYLSVTPGADIYYQFTIENTGDVALTNISISDATVSTASCSWPSSLPAPTSGSDAHITTCVVGPITALSGDNPNTATASGKYSGTTYYSSPSSADYLGGSLDLTLIKQVGTSASGPWSSAISGVAPNSDVYYKFTIANTGTLELSNITLSDPDVDTSSCTFTDPLAAGEATTCIVGPITAPASDGTVSNTATAHASDGTNTLSSSSSANYTVSSNSPDLTVTKAHSPSGNVTLGNTFAWTLTIDNTGAGDATFADGQTIVSDPLPSGPTYGSPATVTGSDVNVTNFGNIGCSIVSGTLKCKASGATVTIGATTGSFQVSLNVTPASTGSLSNTATVDPLGNVSESDETNNTGSDSISVVSATAELTLAKSIFSGNPYDSAGGSIVYNYEVTNTGGAPLSGPVTVNDDKIVTPNSVSCPSVSAIGNNDSNLDPGESVICTATYTVTQDDVDSGSVINTATASADGTDSNQDSQTATATQSPGISLAKNETHTFSTPAAVGDQVNYTFDVGNTGNITLNTIVLADAKCDSGPTYQSGDNTNVDYLDVGEIWSYACIHTLTQAEIDSGSVINNASVTSKLPDGETDGPSDDASVTVSITQDPALNIDKTITSGDPFASVSDVVQYSYLVTNSGNVTLDGPFTVSDDKSTDESCPATASLAPGNSITCTASYTVSQADLDAGSVTNTAYASGSFSGNPVDSATDNATASSTQNPGLTVSKVYDGYTDNDSSSTLNLGDDLNFTVTVTNTGNTTLTGVTVTDPDLTPNSANCASVNPGSTCVLSGSYTVTQSDVDAGSFSNTASATDNTVCPDAGTAICEDTVNTPIPQNPEIGVTKSITNVSFINPTEIALTYSIVVQNIGDTTLNNIQVVDDLTATFSSPATYIVNSVSSSDFAVNTSFNGNSDKNLLQGTDTLAPSDIGTITLVVTVTTNGGDASYTNTAKASGSTPGGQSVNASDSVAGPSFIDPALTKTADPSQAGIGDAVTFTITVTNNGTVDATGVVVTDPLPDNLDYVSASATRNGTPMPSSDITLIAPRTVQVNIGTLATTDTVVITIVTTVNGLGQPPIQNRATVSADAPPEGVSPDPTENNSSTVALSITSSGGGGGNGGGGFSALPRTGFAPNTVTVLPSQPANQSYKDYGETWLEIPRLGLKMPIVGIPVSNNSWDVTWLADQAGWLQGTAFPTWNGNSALTGHVYLSNGQPGPFVNLHSLKWGDQIIIHAFGQRYIYEVRENRVVQPNDVSVFKHEINPWLTLLTCKDYDRATNSYSHRVAISAVLIKVEEDHNTDSPKR